jgi:GNAT superfamily N-acetyltransferase
MPLSVRQAQLEDFDALVPLMKQFAGVREQGLLERFRRVLASPDFVVFVSVLEENVIGYVVAQGHLPRLRSGEESVRLTDLLVDEPYRQLGAGRAMFEAIKTWSVTRGATYLEWRSSTMGIAFYEHLGLKGDPNPQPEYPFFEIKLVDQSEGSSL